MTRNRPPGKLIKMSFAWDSFFPDGSVYSKADSAAQGPPPKTCFILNFAVLPEPVNVCGSPMLSDKTVISRVLKKQLVRHSEEVPASRDRRIPQCGILSD